MARKTSFYYAFLVLPPDQRRAIIAVWDFCRAVDDAVDEESHAAGQWPAGREAVAFSRAELARVFGGGTPQTEQGRALQPFIQRNKTQILKSCREFAPGNFLHISKYQSGHLLIRNFIHNHFETQARIFQREPFNQRIALRNPVCGRIHHHQQPDPGCQTG